MGKGRRPRPARLGEKMASIRHSFGLSQNEMLRHLGLHEELTREEWSAYERGVREPSLPTLLRCARAAGISTDLLIDDDLNLPTKLTVMK
jgi:transcriptional regulator with XRE-family HTH domain